MYIVICIKKYKKKKCPKRRIYIYPCKKSEQIDLLSSL